MNLIAMRTLVVMICLLVSFTVSAQQEKVSSSTPDITTDMDLQEAKKMDPFEWYISNHPESSIVKYYLADPTDRQAIAAIKNASILDNGAQNMFSEQDIMIMQQQVEQVEKIAIQVEKMVQNGTSYQQALSTVKAQSPSEIPSAQQGLSPAPSTTKESLKDKHENPIKSE